MQVLLELVVIPYSSWEMIIGWHRANSCLSERPDMCFIRARRRSCFAKTPVMMPTDLSDSSMPTVLYLVVHWHGVSHNKKHSNSVESTLNRDQQHFSRVFLSGDFWFCASSVLFSLDELSEFCPTLTPLALKTSRGSEEFEFETQHPRVSSRLTAKCLPDIPAVVSKVVRAGRQGPYFLHSHLIFIYLTKLDQSERPFRATFIYNDLP